MSDNICAGNRVNILLDKSNSVIPLNDINDAGNVVIRLLFNCNTFKEDNVNISSGTAVIYTILVIII
jgi:hypothetical protein